METEMAVTTETKSAAERPFGRILVPTDLTQVAAYAFKVAVDLARRTGASVELMTVLGPIEGDIYSPVQYSPEASVGHENAEALIRKELVDLAREYSVAGVDVEVTTRKGRPIPSIAARADQLGADLIVVGTHEHGRLHHYLVGSAAEEVVRHAPCSVLVVHEQDASPPDDIRSILVPVDLSDYAPALLRYAKSIADLFRARLDVIHVVEPIPLLDTVAGAMTLRDVVPDMTRRAKAVIQELLATVDFESTPHEVHVAEGQAASQILNEATRRSSGMIVMGKQGRSAIERFLVGSVTERVVRHGACPVLVARVGAAET